MGLHTIHGGMPDSQIRRLLNGYCQSYEKWGELYFMAVGPNSTGDNIEILQYDVSTTISSPSKSVLAELEFVQHRHSIPRCSTHLRFATAARFTAQRKVDMCQRVETNLLQDPLIPTR